MVRRGEGGWWRREGLYRGDSHGVAVTGACNDRSPCRLVTAILSLPPPKPPPHRHRRPRRSFTGERHVQSTRGKDVGGVRAMHAIRSDRYMGLWDIFHPCFPFFSFFFLFHVFLPLDQRSAGRAITSVNRSGHRWCRITARWTTFAGIICRQNFRTMSCYYLHRERERERERERDGGGEN